MFDYCPDKGKGKHRVHPSLGKKGRKGEAGATGTWSGDQTPTRCFTAMRILNTHDRVQMAALFLPHIMPTRAQGNCTLAQSRSLTNVIKPRVKIIISILSTTQVCLNIT